MLDLQEITPEYLAGPVTVPDLRPEANDPWDLVLVVGVDHQLVCCALLYDCRLQIMPTPMHIHLDVRGGSVHRLRMSEQQGPCTMNPMVHVRMTEARATLSDGVYDWVVNPSSIP